MLIKFAFISFGTKAFRNSTNKIDEQIMKYVMRCNLKQSYALYNENKSTQLLKIIFREFKKKVIVNNKKVFFIVAPQLLDLELRKIMNELPYEKFYRNLKTEYDIIDLTEDLFNLPLEKLYVNDIYGGHFSVYGNDVVAKLLEKKIKLK